MNAMGSTPLSIVLVASLVAAACVVLGGDTVTASAARGGSGVPMLSAPGADRSCDSRVDDQQIRRTVKSKFFANAHLRGQRIKLVSRHGVVTLSCSVAEPGDRAAAEQLARDTDGVCRVVNLLRGPAQSK
jgi:osmotically-inducible protein OsmY